MAREVPPFITIGEAANAVLQGLSAKLLRDMPAEVQAAVDAYDDARRTAYGRQHEPAMSDANKATIAPFILAAVAAYLNVINRSAA